MKIENFSTEKQQGRARVSATIAWEDCDRPAHEIYFETISEFADDLTCNPDAFLVSCVMAAMHYGEKRIYVDAEICPELQQNLIVAMDYIRHWYDWYPETHKRLTIEAKLKSNVSKVPARAGWFCSGGIDSLSTLRTNHLTYPKSHPAYIRDGIFIYGFDFGKSEELDERDAYEKIKTLLLNITRDADVNLIPVYTNIRQKLDSGTFWRNELSGAALSAVAHALSNRFNVVSLASGSDIPHLVPLAQHPLLHTNYSSYNLKIRHDCVHLSRLEKTQLVCDWDTALRNLRVCNYIERMKGERLNCGKCEKCVRTMIQLLTLNKLKELKTFPTNNVSEEMLVKTLYLKSPYEVACYEDLIGLLEVQGRYDLIRGIQRVVARYHETDWRGRFKRLDRSLFGGNLNKLKQLKIRFN